MKIKVLIADDNSFIREGMKIILASFDEFEVVGTVDDGTEAVAFCNQHEVDVVLLDVRMPRMNGVEAARQIVAQTKVKPLILTTFDDDEYIIEALKAGACGYLLKNNDPERIRDAIKSVYHDHHVLQDVILDKIKSNLYTNSHTNLPNSSAQPPASAYVQSQGIKHKIETEGYPFDRSLFTERELEIMTQISNGLSNKEIAKKLYISEGTVANYITSILNKTGLEHRTQIAIYYLTGKVNTSDEP